MNSTDDMVEKLPHTRNEKKKNTNRLSSKCEHHLQHKGPIQHTAVHQNLNLKSRPRYYLSATTAAHKRIVHLKQAPTLQSKPVTDPQNSNQLHTKAAKQS